MTHEELFHPILPPEFTAIGGMTAGVARQAWVQLGRRACDGLDLRVFGFGFE